MKPSPVQAPAAAAGAGSFLLWAQDARLAGGLAAAAGCLPSDLDEIVLRLAGLDGGLQLDAAEARFVEAGILLAIGHARGTAGS